MSDTSQIAHFKGILMNTQGGDTQKIKQAEVEIKNMRDTNFIAFIQNLMIVVNEVPGADGSDEYENVRKLAAILFKNSLQNGIFEEEPANFQGSLWFQLNQDMRQQIKQMLLGTLGGDLSA